MKGWKDNQKKYIVKLDNSDDVWTAGPDLLNNLYDWGNLADYTKDNKQEWDAYYKGEYVRGAYQGNLPMKGSVLSAMDPYQENYELQKADHAAILKKWGGAVIRFHPHTAYNMLYSPLVAPIHPAQSNSTSRQDWSEAPFTKCGTVVHIDDKPNYKGQWHVTILWPDGLMSYENISDLTIVFPESES